MPDEAKKPIVQINPMRVKLAEVDRQDWVATAEMGTTLEQIIEPSYWAHMASKLKPYDHIEVRVDDGIWLAQLLVKEAGRNWAAVLMLQSYKLETADVAQTRSSKYKIDWKGPHLKFCVIRLEDGERLQEQMTKRDAQVWLENYERTVS